MKAIPRTIKAVLGIAGNGRPAAISAELEGREEGKQTFSTIERELNVNYTECFSLIGVIMAGISTMATAYLVAKGYKKVNGWQGPHKPVSKRRKRRNRGTKPPLP